MEQQSTMRRETADKENLFFYPVYDGDDLGCVVGENRISFRVWAPSAEQVWIRLYENGTDGDPIECVEMVPAEQGTWQKSFDHNRKGLYYTYLVSINGRNPEETIDPYAKACGVNGKRGMVIDLKETDPPGFDRDRGPYAENKVDLIIGETSVVDATIDASCGSSEPGKFLGLAESGTKTGTGIATGLDHLSELGITHVQLMPFYDFATVDEAEQEAAQYNWGYDPLNYNIPEGSYSTDPYHGEVRIRECKQMIQALHRKGIGVIMDVVYNHVFDVAGSSLQKTVPDYYFRKVRDPRSGDWFYSNGSGCGNEIASERPMVRKYLIDSLCYWTREYHIDGFRFDLMGVLDMETMNLAAKALRKIRPDIILYGEGWAGGNAAWPENRRALKANVTGLNGYAVFSDDIRDHIKGSVFDWKACGYANGAAEKENAIRCSVAAATPHPQADYKNYSYIGERAWAENPDQVINYVSCHDNPTLWDKLTASCPEENEAERLKINRLCAAIIFTSQGIPFLLEGEEFARSKPIRGTSRTSDNSYNLPVFTNTIRYNRIRKYRSLYEYYRGLIAFRKAHSALRLRTGKQIAENLRFLKNLPANVVAFRVKDDSEELLVIYNANKEPVSLTLEDDCTWQVCMKGKKAGTEVLGVVKNKVKVPERSALAAVRMNCFYK